MDVKEGSLARINLTDKEISLEDFSKYTDFIGGRGVNQYILFNEMPLDTSPFDPGTPIIFGAGLLAGTEAPGSSRLNIDSKNVLTGGIGSSNVGGNFASEMRKAGINNIVITGKCEETSYLLIEDDNIKIIFDDRLFEKTTKETDKLLNKKHGGEVLCIGPAGDNLVRSACIIVNGSRAAGRCGLGAIMGSKNLKAIVVRGTSDIEVSDEDEFQKIIEEWEEKFYNSEFIQRRMKYGVYCYDAPWDIESPYQNFSGKIPPEKKKQKLMPEEFFKYLTDKKSCDSCPIECWTEHEFKDNDKRYHVEALQGNDPHNFGAKLDLDTPKEVLKAHKLCNDLGLDTDNVTGAISWAIESFEKGQITEKDTNGLTLEWGDFELIYDLIEKTAYRIGFGDLLAEGCKRSSESIGKGSEENCIHVKGQELFECLWMSPSWALGTMVSPRGGTHTRGAAIEERMQGMPKNKLKKYFDLEKLGDITSYKGKENLVYFFERLQGFLDSAGICLFTNSLRMDMILPEDYSKLYSVATGKSVNWKDILRIGEKVHNIERAYNALYTDWSREDDLPPKRFVENKLAGKYGIDFEEWNKMLDRYYELHGWDEDGIPTTEKLNALGLEEVAEKITQHQN